MNFYILLSYVEFGLLVDYCEGMLRILRHCGSTTTVDFLLLTGGIVVCRKDDGTPLGMPFQNFATADAITNTARAPGWRDLSIEDFERLADALDKVHQEMKPNAPSKTRLYLTNPPAYGLNARNVRPKQFSYKATEATQQPAGQRVRMTVMMRIFSGGASGGCTSNR